MTHVRRTRTYRASKHGRAPTAIEVRAADLGVPTDATPDPDRNRRAACGCLILIAVTLTGLVCGGALFIATVLTPMLDW